MANKPRKLISFDWAIKKNIFKCKSYNEILEGFLSELLFDDIRITEILETENNENRFVEFNQLDIKVKNLKNEDILIEIQCDRELEHMQRMFHIFSKTTVKHNKKSKHFSKIAKVISIYILYFDLGEGDDYIYRGTTSYIGMHNRSALKLDEIQAELYKTDKIENISVEHYLIKVNNFNDIAKNTLDQWIYLLKNEDIKEDFTAKGLAKAKEVLAYWQYSEQERIEYENHRESLHYHASMYESTYIIGKIEGRMAVERKIAEELATAKAMLQKGFDVQTVVDITSMTEQVVLQLLEKNK